MTASPYDLTTVANLQSYLTTTTNDTTLLQRMITACSLAIENYLNRDIVSLTYNEVFDGPGGDILMLPDYPITAVASVTINGQSIPVGNSYSTPGYYFDKNRIMLNGYGFTRGNANVAVTYTAGYATVPGDLEQCCIGWVQYQFNDRNRGGETSRSMAGQTIAFSQKDMPEWCKTILNQWKRTFTA